VHHLNNPDPPVGNSMDSEPGRTRDEASRGDQDEEDRQSFRMGSINSTVDASSQSRELRPLALVQEIRSRDFQRNPLYVNVTLIQVGSFRLGPPSTVGVSNHWSATHRGPRHVSWGAVERTAMDHVSTCPSMRARSCLPITALVSAAAALGTVHITHLISSGCAVIGDWSQPRRTGSCAVKRPTSPWLRPITAHSVQMK